MRINFAIQKRINIKSATNGIKKNFRCQIQEEKLKRNNN